MHNKNGRTDAEEAAANQTGGALNQVKGRVKQAIGDLAGDNSLHRSGTKDEVKGKLQEAYGETKEKEARLEENLRNLDDGRV